MKERERRGRGRGRRGTNFRASAHRRTFANGKSRARYERSYDIRRIGRLACTRGKSWKIRGSRGRGK